MEALAALEAAAQGCDDAPSVSESGRSSEEQGGHGNIVTTPTSKRRRLRGFSGGLFGPKGEASPGTSHSPSSIVKREEDQDNDASVELRTSGPARSFSTTASRVLCQQLAPLM